MFQLEYLGGGGGGGGGLGALLMCYDRRGIGSAIAFDWSLFASCDKKGGLFNPCRLLKIDASVSFLFEIV